MKLLITNLYGHSPTSTALIAQNMVSDIADELGFKEVDYFSYPVETDSPEQLKARIDGIVPSIGRDDMIVIQSPMWNGVKFETEFVHTLRSYYANINIVYFLHDVVPYMFEKSGELLQDYLSLYNLADVIVSPSEQMAQALIKDGLAVDKIVYQGMWDHTMNAVELGTPSFSNTLHYTGAIERYSLQQLGNLNIPLHIYSSEQILGSQVVHHDWMSDIELQQTFVKTGGFGLIWAESEFDQNYLSMNNPFKLGTYLAAGIPVIVPPYFSGRKLVEDNGLGVVLDNLDDIELYLNDLTREDYNELLKNVKNHRFLIQNGYYTKKWLTDAVHQAFRK